MFLVYIPLTARKCLLNALRSQCNIFTLYATQLTLSEYSTCISLINRNQHHRGGGLYTIAPGLVYDLSTTPSFPPVFPSSLILTSFSSSAMIQQQQHKLFTQSPGTLPLPSFISYFLRIRVCWIAVSSTLKPQSTDQAIQEPLTAE